VSLLSTLFIPDLPWPPERKGWVERTQWLRQDPRIEVKSGAAATPGVNNVVRNYS